MRDMDIAEVVRRSGVPASASRYYEEKGLIASQGRRGLRRQYPASVLDSLSMIALGRVAGFSLDEIVLMFATDGIDRHMLAAKLAGPRQNVPRPRRGKVEVHQPLSDSALCRKIGNRSGRRRLASRAEQLLHASTRIQSLATPSQVRNYNK